MWIGGGISLWFPLRQARCMSRSIPTAWNAAATSARSGSAGKMWSDSSWATIICGRRESAPVGTVYSVYSLRTRLSFLAKLPAAAELAGLISDATGLPWQ